MSRGGNRLKYQVEKALKKINYIGYSKKKFKDAGMETGIHSTTQMKHALSICQNFAEWVKGQGIKDLFRLKRSHYREYVGYLQTKNLSNGYLINVETNLRLLGKGMNKISEEKGMKLRDWVPNIRSIDVKTREKPVDRSYSQDQIGIFYEKLSHNAKIGADLQLAFGLRLREAANTKVANIIEKDGKLYWIAVSGKKALNTAVGVTKAGRGRITPCKPEMESKLREIIKDKPAHSYIVPIKYNTLKSAYNRVNLRV